MLNTKYQVFISSPFKNLEEQRRAAVRAVLKFRHIPIALENFPPKTKKDVDIISQVVRDSQIYILILGHRYGSIVDGYDISYTELEFDIAKETGLDILSFILNIDEARKEILGDDSLTDKTNEINRLERFHHKIKKHSLSKPWYKETNFGEEFTLGLGELLLEGVNKPGWVKADESLETKNVYMALKNVFTLDTVKNLNGFKPLDERCSQDKIEKETIAKCIKELFLDRFIKNKNALFFESGSSPAFVAREFGRSDKFRKAVEKSSIKLYTNNILAFLDLWLNGRLPVSMLPNSSPREKYGASYGILDTHIDEDRCPDFTGNPLDQFALDAIEELKESDDALPKNENIVVISSISGVQFSDNHKIETLEGYSIDDVISEKINNCFGYHVGSYKSKIFKRYLLNCNFPTITTLTYQKINMGIDSTRCHFIFDDEYQWENFLSQYPLSFCVGCKKTELSEVIDLFNNLGFTVMRYTNGAGYFAVLAMNEFFKQDYYR
jgi:hypothetical protein